MILLSCLKALFGSFDLPAGVPAWQVQAYPLLMAGIAEAYGRLLRHRASVGTARLVVGCWVGVAGWRGYCRLREVVAGLDYLAASLALFALAVLVSLAKSGVLAHRLALWAGRATHSTS